MDLGYRRYYSHQHQYLAQQCVLKYLISRGEVRQIFVHATSTVAELI